jgi:hypothetical protein
MRASAFALAALLCGCALSNPQISEIWDADYPGDPGQPGDPYSRTPPVSATAQIEFEIKKRIYCELRDAVSTANTYPIYGSETLKGKRELMRTSLIPDNWAAQIALSLQVDESSALNVSVSYTDVLANAVKTFGVGNSVSSGQSTSVGLGGILSSTATRIDKFNPYYTVRSLSVPITPNSACYVDPNDPESTDPFHNVSIKPAKSSPFLIESDLGIKNWLIGSMVVNNLLESTLEEPKGASDDSKKKGNAKAGAKQAPGSGGGPKPDSVTYEIRFVILSSGNVTPTWKLIPISANTGALPFVNISRMRTHDLIITLGAIGDPLAFQSHFAAQINAVRR